MPKTDQQLADEMQARQEAEYLNRLAAQRANYPTAQTQNSTLLLRGPSLIKYALILLLFAIPNDVIDIIDVTIAGWLLSWIISTFLSLTTIILMWFSDSEFQRVKSHIANKNRNQQTLAKTTTKFASRLSRFAPRNPIVKIIAGAALEMVPIISVLPWSSISVFLAYRDEKSSFKEARKALELNTKEDFDYFPETTPETI